MDQALGMRGRESARHLLTQPQRVRHVEWPVGVQELLQRLAWNVFHHEVRDRLFFDGMDRHDVVMRNLSLLAARAGF